MIKINGRQSKDPLTDVLSFPFGDTLSYDASASTADSGKIVSYFWDFGDQKSSTEAVTAHSYKKDLTQVFPVLRVKDSNGFIADSFVEVENQLLGQQKPLTNTNQNGILPKPTLSPKKSSTPSQLKFTLMGVAILGLVIFASYNFLKKKKRV